MGREYTRNVDVLSLQPLSGNLLLYDDFSTLKKYKEDARTGSDFADIVNDYPEINPWQLQIRTRITSAAAGDTHGVVWATQPGLSKMVRVALWFFTPSLVDFTSIRFLTTFQNGATYQQSKIYYDGVNAKWIYFNSAGAAVDVTNGAQPLLTNYWHYIEIDTDFQSNKYMRLQCNQKIMNLAGISLYSSGATTAEQFQFNLTQCQAGANYISLYATLLSIKSI
jgi:hypothetical protein